MSVAETLPASLPPPGELIPPGIYLDLPMSRYLADPALSGSAFDKLEREPADWKWERPENPLYEAPEEDSKARFMGSVCHCAVLEGLDVYERTYGVKPAKEDHPDALDTIDQMGAWLVERGLKKSGRKDELIARILEHDPRAKIWDAFCQGSVGDRIAISAKMDRQARLLDGYVRSDPTFSKLLSGGLAEVSVFWIEDHVRYKCRIDYLRPTAVIDLKTYGRPPRRGAVRSFLADRVSHGDDKQAVHNWRAAQQIPMLMEEGLVLSNSIAKVKLLEEIAAHPKVFVWLGLRVNGAPSGLAVRFDQGTLPWTWAEEKIRYAVAQYQIYREKFGDDVWVRNSAFPANVGVIVPDVADWPSWASELPV